MGGGIDAHIAVDGGDPDQVGSLGGHHESDSVVDSGVAVDEHRHTFHREMLRRDESVDFVSGGK